MRKQNVSKQRWSPASSLKPATEFLKSFNCTLLSTGQTDAIQSADGFSGAKCQKLFKHIGTKVWNNIPQELKDYPFSKLKTTYKKQLIQKYVSLSS